MSSENTTSQAPAKSADPYASLNPKYADFSMDSLVGFCIFAQKAVKPTDSNGADHVISPAVIVGGGCTI